MRPKPTNKNTHATCSVEPSSEIPDPRFLKNIPMTFRLLKTVKINGVTHKKGETFPIDPSTDRIEDNELQWSFGHGDNWNFEIDKDIVIEYPRF